MLKHIYRILILVFVFVASLWYFSQDIKEVVFDIDNTTTMAEVTFPMVRIRAEGEIINRLHGYSSNLDANLVWEGVTPLSTDQTFELLIQQEAYDIKKVNYEIREFVDNKLIESDSVSVFDMENQEKVVRVKIKEALNKDKEYALKITLITSESKKMYFYQRVKQVTNSQINEKLTFVREFHSAIFDKDNADWIKDRLEPKPKKDNSSLANVNINSSFDVITWGELKPKILTMVVPTITEINTSFASVELDYMVEAEIAGMKELFRVNEFYRIQYTRGKAYLLKYERNMNSFFDINLASKSKSQLKLGITTDESLPYVLSVDEKKMAFVRNRELWYYNLVENRLVRVFSFRQEKTDYLRDFNNRHEIQVIDMDAEGNIHFLVYGYMNRGQYEGKVGVILYEYMVSEDRIEEKVYIPVDEPFDTLRESMGHWAYVNAYDEFYFQMYNHIYSYSLITKQMKEIAKGVGKEQLVFLKNKGYIAWQTEADPQQSTTIKILQLDTGEEKSIVAPQGYRIKLLDMIDSNLVYGFAMVDDITQVMDGSTVVALSKVEIASFDTKVLKSYSNEGYFVTGVSVSGNIIQMDLVEQVMIGGRVTYAPTAPDYIMNQVKVEKKFLEVVHRVTDEALTEYYVSLPSWFQLNAIPKIQYTVNTIITEDPTLRLPYSTQPTFEYYAYMMGDLIGTYKELSDAIAMVRDGAGVVLDSQRRLVWEQGVRGSQSIISSYENTTTTPSNETLRTTVSLLFKTMGKNLGPSQIDLSNYSVYDIIKQNGQGVALRLTGASLDDVLYYVSKGSPVLAMVDGQNAILIYGYDTFNIHVIDPKLGRSKKIGLQDSKELFEKAGNIFISYLNQ